MDLRYFSLSYKHSILLIVLILNLSVGVLYAQMEVNSTFLTTGNHLASNTIRHIYQDKKGYIWLGTLNGLSRYDGTSFVNFRTDVSADITLSDHRIYEMTEDKDGFLWIRTYSSIYSCFDLDKACFVDFNNGHSPSRYSGIFLASDGYIYFWGEGRGLLRIKWNGVAFERMLYDESVNTIFSGEVRNLFEDSAGNVWACLNNGVVSIQNERLDVYETGRRMFNGIELNREIYFLSYTGEVMQFRDNALYTVQRIQSSLPFTTTSSLGMGKNWYLLTSQGIFLFNTEDNSIQPDRELLGVELKNGLVLKDNRGERWVYNGSGKMWRIDVADGKPLCFNLFPPEKIGYIDRERYQILQDSKGRIWISTYGNGLFVYHPDTKQTDHLTSVKNGEGHLSADYLLCIAEDRSGAIWVGAEYAGLCKLSILNDGVKHHLMVKNPTIDRENAIRVIKQTDDGCYWISTRQGILYKLDSNFNPLKSESFQHNVYDINNDDDGTLWIATRGEGIRIGDRWYANRSGDTTSLKNNNVFNIEKDSKGRMWAATFGGGLVVALKSGENYHFRSFLNETQLQQQVRCILFDKAGRLWAGSSEGVCVMTPDSILLNPKNYLWFTARNSAMLSSDIRCIKQHSNGSVMVGTAGGGLSIYTPQEGTDAISFDNLTTKEGLINDVVQGIEEDSEGNLWISTELGVSKLNIERMTFENHIFSAALLGNSYSDNCSWKNNKGEILFGSNNGLIIINPQSVKRQNYLSPVVFTHLKLNGIDIFPSNDSDNPLQESLSYLDKITLPYNQNSVAIEFSNFNFSEMPRNKYAYRLDPYDSEWSIPSELNFCSYKNLPVGKYRLRVKVQNSRGAFNNPESVLAITIRPPFWLSWWAYAIYAVLIVMFFYAVLKILRHFNTLRTKIAVEKQLTEYKLRFFTNISHEFRTPLTLILGAFEKLDRLKDLPDSTHPPLHTIQKSVKRMMRLIDQLLEFRKIQNDKQALSLEETNITSFVYEIYLTFTDIAESKQMNFVFDSAPDLKGYVDKGKLDKIVYNLVSNAFKYTPTGGNVTLKLEVSDAGILTIRVSDSGVGIAPEKRSQLFTRFMQTNFPGDSMGIGLNLVSELVNVHKGAILFEPNKEAGSVFTVTIPIDKQTYESKDFIAYVYPPSHVEMPTSLSTLSDSSLTVALPLPTPLNNRRILIIEDDIDVYTFLREEVGQYFVVDVAIDGEMGLEKATSLDFDLIVCDVMMPGMTGFELTKRLKSNFETSHIPIILVTALSNTESHLEGIETGADAYLTKPFHTDILISRIVQLIRQREALREKYTTAIETSSVSICTTEQDKEFVDRLQTVMDKHLNDTDFNVDIFASEMKLGRTVFFKKVKGVIGCSPNEFIRMHRLKKGAELLKSTQFTISEVAYQVGFSDPFYFSKCFKLQFGSSPSQYIHK